MYISRIQFVISWIEFMISWNKFVISCTYQEFNYYFVIIDLLTVIVVTMIAGFVDCRFVDCRFLQCIPSSGCGTSALSVNATSVRKASWNITYVFIPPMQSRAAFATGKKFAHWCSLQYHIVSHSSGDERPASCMEKEKSFACSACLKRFPSKAHLQRHESFIHNAVKPFSCNICGRAFTLLAGLTCHRITHTMARPYSGTLCSKTYRNRVDLRLHCARVHDVQLPALKV